MSRRKWMGVRRMTYILLSLLLLAGCSTASDAQVSSPDDSYEKVIDARQLVVGLDDNYPPMGFRDASGEIVGFDIDVAREVCARLRINLVLQPIDWDKKVDVLNSGEIDCIWNGMSVTPDREEAMSLSEPYIKNTLIFVVAETSTAKGIRDLKGQTIGVQSGSSVVEALEGSSIYSEITVAEYENNTLLVEDLAQGKIDAILIDSIAAYYFIFTSEHKFYVLSDSISEESCAVGFRKEDRALRDTVQEILKEMKDDGSLGEISQKWFGTDITIVR